MWDSRPLPHCTHGLFRVSSPVGEQTGSFLAIPYSSSRLPQSWWSVHHPAHSLTLPWASSLKLISLMGLVYSISYTSMCTSQDFRPTCRAQFSVTISWDGDGILYTFPTNGASSYRIAVCPFPSIQGYLRKLIFLSPWVQLVYLTLFLLISSSATTAGKLAGIFTQLCRTCGRTPSWWGIVGPESISSQITLHFVSLSVQFCDLTVSNLVCYLMAVCWVSWKPCNAHF